MLYFKVLRQGLAALPPADDSVRRALEQPALDKGWPAMHAVLSQLDPVTAGRIQPNDSQRIQRALEVCYLTGKSMSEILEQQQNADFPFRVFKIALLPGDRSILHDRISQRFAAMLEAGLVDEVHLIRELFHVDSDMPSMRCVGYRQVCMYLDDEISFARMQETGVFATRQLAKRQLTWLRSMNGLQVFNCLENRLVRQIIDFIRAQRLFS